MEPQMNADERGSKAKAFHGLYLRLSAFICGFNIHIK
jgi:hypothetical protein